jgi:hypothetical protein
MISSLILNAAQGNAALRCFTNGSWWDWKLGSTLCYWRWGEALPLSHVRDGIPIFVMGKLPRASRNQRGPAKYKAPLLASKLDKVLERQYIRKGPVKAFIDYFDMPKVLDDIRVVYHGSKSGLNAQLCTSRLYMPNGSAALNDMSFETYLTYSDVGEMFPNFPMDPKLRPHAGVDLRSLSHCLKNYETPISDEESERWERLFMGMAPSPYISIRMYYVAEEFCRGPASAKDNPMGYDEVRLNLPGSSDFNPSLPWVVRWSQAAKAIAGDVVTFVDDLLASGHSVENSWQVYRQLGSRIQYLGIQDAPCKRRLPSQTPGAWAGGIFSSANGRITKYVSVENWKGGQTMIWWLQDEVNACPNNRPWLNFKRLESTAGFLCHLSMTHEGFRPFLKEIYLTLNSWLSQRDEDG